MKKEKEIKYHKCRKCDKDAVGCFSPDLDIVGLCFCADHKEDVMLEYVQIIQKAREEFRPSEYYFQPKK